MKLAVTSNDGWAVAGPLGHCRRFLIYEVAGQTVRRAEIRPLEPSGPCPCRSPGLLQLLADCQVVMSAEMSQTAFDQFVAQGIRPVVTSEASADQAVRRFIDGSLILGEAAPCHCQHGAASFPSSEG